MHVQLSANYAEDYDNTMPGRLSCSNPKPSQALDLHVRSISEKPLQAPLSKPLSEEFLRASPEHGELHQKLYRIAAKELKSSYHNIGII